MARTRFGKAGNAAIDQDAAKLGQGPVGIGDVMQGVKTADSLDAAIGEIDPASVKDQKPGRRPVTENGLAGVEFFAQTEGCGRDVDGRHLTAELAQVARGPAGPGAEIEDADSRVEIETLKQLGKADKQIGRFFERVERLCEEMIGGGYPGEILFRFLTMLFDGEARQQLPNIHPLDGLRPPWISRVPPGYRLSVLMSLSWATLPGVADYGAGYRPPNAPADLVGPESH